MEEEELVLYRASECEPCEQTSAKRNVRLPFMCCYKIKLKCSLCGPFQTVLIPVAAGCVLNTLPRNTLSVKDRTEIVCKCVDPCRIRYALTS
jgi:hypothetical protein